MDSCDSLCDSVGSARLLGHPPDLRRGRRGTQPLASKDAVLVSIMGGQRDNLVGPQLGNVTGKVGRQRNLIQWNTHIEAHRRTPLAHRTVEESRRAWRNCWLNSPVSMSPCGRGVDQILSFARQVPSSRSMTVPTTAINGVGFEVDHLVSLPSCVSFILRIKQRVEMCGTAVPRSMPTAVTSASLHLPRSNLVR